MCSKMMIAKSFSLMVRAGSLAVLRALSDATTMIPLGQIEKLVRQARAIHDLVRIQESGE